MSDYRMDISGIIQLSDYSSIFDYMAIVNRNDNLTISMHDVDSESIGIICNMLEKNNFKVELNNSFGSGRCLIRASKDTNV